MAWGEQELQVSATPLDQLDGEFEEEFSSDMGIISSDVKRKMTMWFTDQCDDGATPTLKVFDRTSKRSYGPWAMNPYNTAGYVKIRCEKGHKICYGAWTDALYWGCGPGCKYGCTNCCTRCGHKTMNNVNFTCD